MFFIYLSKFILSELFTRNYKKNNQSGSKNTKEKDLQKKH